ncbi:putative disease resistance protein RGA1 isoform X2 [Phragmites australis]|uniref:putative disease resistance protein RGA1 isoform X2 n=1 Tax=Phragmites australis TaxID=29695 RepID=UPI002D7984D3|nr:putative disease resistance protein RGA1 isoform X2 [Phragmites australis]XP_062226785.1 putative disease resistance protein RGA1 isoform X2 [Phragmites australis]XP_062226786.1 putative disease resistance protein RGA1 isoform X2 [Phragmites australis]XP_062226787.1 putative disease resistance protein RGA1 isoform X2 [Phragmites australis]XP_062226788.1 putative disease resistance protein RGA1 isoform X2 [Phragmites australis]XP_062226789.1 putative disease resistance protein RGA1 isoform X
MEVGEAVVEAAIGWLVGSVLNLFTEKLVAWTYEVGLAHDVEKFKSAMMYVQIVLAAANGTKIENQPLAQSLSDLKGLLYDAEDVMDELDYYRLKEQVTSGNTGAGSVTVAHNTTTSSTSSRNFVRQIGSAVMERLKKRKREDDHNIAANRHLGNMTTEFSRTIKDIADKLRELGGDVSNALKIDVSNFRVASNLNQNTPKDTRLTSSYLVEPKVYGRDAEMESILKLMASNRSNGITVLPIVGIGGIGKTTLAQLVYNDPMVANQFQIKIWVWVSDNFNVPRLTREMLDCASKQRQAETSNLNKLQEDLEKSMKSRRFLIVLDDVWDDMNEDSWNQLLAPLKRKAMGNQEMCSQEMGNLEMGNQAMGNQEMGNMILVTTRKLSVAEMTKTVEPIMLRAMEGDDFWQLFESYAFGDRQYKDQRLYNIGKQIARELMGNPLAAKTVGALLRRNMNIDNWTNILNSEEWKSLPGLMPVLKLSYDYLPGHLQHCFKYCCLFPKDYRFGGAELVRIWISQGFVDGSRTSKSLEDTGNDYLADLVDSGFFEKIGRDGHSPECFVMHDLIHDLAWQVSKDEFGTINDRDCEEILPTVRHLSIVTDSEFSHEIFEKKMLQVKSARKLRSLVLIGYYDPSFFRYFQNMFKQAENLRLLQICATYADFVSFLSSLVNCSHLRYLKLDNKGSDEALPISLRNFYHLEVIDAGHPTIVHGMYDLVSMRYLVVTKGARSSVTSVGEMSDHQDVPNFTDQNSSCSEITQLQSMNKLVQLGVFQLENVSSAEASGARLRDKQHLQKLGLSWNDTLSQDGYDSQSSEQFVDTAKEVIEGLEPHRNLKHLQISGYSGATSPAWLATSVSCLQTLHLEDCGQWQILPSLGRLSFLTKLKLRKMQKVIEVSIPSLEKLVLIEMPKLERCSCNSVRDLNSSLRILEIEKCSKLKVFPLLESCEKHKIEKKSWLPRLSELTIHDCPYLMVAYPLPPSSSGCKLSIARVSTLPTMEGSSNGELIIGADSYDGEFDEDSDGLTNLDDKIVSFHNLRDLTRLQIVRCQNLSSISLEGFRQLISLKSLEIDFCGKLFSSVVVPEHTHEYMADANFIALPSLKYLRIDSWGITGKWLTVILKHVPVLEELDLNDLNISGLLIEGKESGLSHLTSAHRASSSGNRDDAMTSSTPDGLLRVPSKLIPSLKRMSIWDCRNLTFQMSQEGFAGFTSLEELTVVGCPRLIPSSVHKDENNDQGTGRWLLPHSLGRLTINHSTEILRPYFEENHTCLKKLEVTNSPSLRCLKLDSCTALEGLDIHGCESLTALEGLDSCTTLEEMMIRHCGSFTELGGFSGFTSLKKLTIWECPRLIPSLVHKDENSDQGTGRWFLPHSLGELKINHSAEILQPCFEENHNCLKKLEIWGSPSLKCLQLDFCTALEEMAIGGCGSLTALQGLQSLGGLRYLIVCRCPGLPPCLEHLSRQGYELCPRLETLQIDDYSFLTKSFCKHLTSLQRLQLHALSRQVTKLTDEQESALRLLTSLQELDFQNCRSLADLPVGLHSLPSLKRLKIFNCGSISRLPQMGLPPTLEELDVSWCSDELSEQCRKLATSKLKVKIDCLLQGGT